ncbi:MAG: O-antigen ligase family protein [Bacillota bacterium]
MDLSKLTRILLYIVVIMSVLFSPAAYLGILPILMLLIYQEKHQQLIEMFLKNKPIMIICLCIALSTFFSKEPLFSIAADVILFLLIAFWLILVFVVSPGRLDSLYRLLSIICFAVCIFGIYQVFSGDTEGLKSWVDQNSFGSLKRIYSTLQNPNIFAGYIVINLCFFISKYIHNDRLKDALLVPNILLLSACLILTYSRGGFISFCIAMSLLLIFKRNKALVLYMAVMVAAFYLYNSLGNINRAELDAIYKDSSNTYRIEIWRAAIQIFVQNPITGHGVGTLWYHLSTYSAKLYKYVIHAHSIYLHVAAELGVIGLGAFLYFAVIEFFGALKLWINNETDKNRYIFMGYLCSLTAIMAHGVFDAVIFIPSLSMIFISYFSLYKLASASADVSGKKNLLGFIARSLDRKGSCNSSI